MLHTYSSLAKYNPDTLARKAAAIGDALGGGWGRGEVGAILARAPRALGASVCAIEARLDALEWLILGRRGHGAGGGYSSGDEDDLDGVDGGEQTGGRRRGGEARRPGGGGGGGRRGGGANQAAASASGRPEMREMIERLPWLLTLSPKQVERRLRVLEEGLAAPREQVGGFAMRFKWGGPVQVEGARLFLLLNNPPGLAPTPHTSDSQPF